MVEKAKQANRIPFEDIADSEAVSAWSLPSMGEESRVFLSAKKEQEKRKKNKANTEIVEDYEGDVEEKPITAEELQRLTEEAKKDGFDQGYAEGMRQGLQEGSAKGEKDAHNRVYKETKAVIDGEIAQLREIAGSLFEPMSAQQDMLEKIVVDMAVHFTEKLLHDHIEQVPQSLLSTVKKALTALPVGAKHICVHCHELDAKLIEKHLPKEYREWSIKVDSEVTRGGCKISTQDSLVDYTVNSRLKIFLQQVQDQGDIDASQLEPVKDYTPTSTTTSHEIASDTINTKPEEQQTLLKESSISSEGVAPESAVNTKEKSNVTQDVNAIDAMADQRIASDAIAVQRDTTSENTPAQNIVGK